MSTQLLTHLLNPHSYLVLLRRILSSFMRLKITSNPVLFMTILVRNEEDIIESNLLFHKAMGIDGFIVTDNNSTDKTLKILQEYKDKGWIKEIIIERDNDYSQDKWVNRMVNIAKNKYHADWVINADADEFWYSHTGSLKSEISKTTSNVIICPLINVIPKESLPLTLWDEVVISPLENPENLGLSRYSIYSIQHPKVLHRTNGFRSIYMGNHGVDIFPKKIQKHTNIMIYHYPIRGYVHFLNKVKNGGSALLQNPNNKVGTHWRALYDIYLCDKLLEEYDKVIGNTMLSSLVDTGVVVRDSNIKQAFSQIISVDS